MCWRFQVLPHAVIIRMFGVVNQTLGEMFEKAAERAICLNNRQVVMDFSDVESIDALGLVLCGYGLHHFQQLGIPVALVQPPASLLGHGMPETPPVFLQDQSISERH